jgi:uncharacterized membrane protein YphA (DoxX/SURF4 family)
LLLLRWVLCAALLFQGGLYLDKAEALAPGWAVGLVALITGSMLLVGFFTPIAAVLAALCVVSARAFPVPASAPNLFGQRFSVILSVTVLVAVTLLGPGAFSVDARRFGRRKIIIPASGLRR